MALSKTGFAGQLHPKEIPKKTARNFPGRADSIFYFLFSGFHALFFSSICSLRYTSELMSYVASSNPCPCVIASVGQASTQ
jgi:hypothetical protein